MTPVAPNILFVAATAALAERVCVRLAGHRVRVVFSILEAIAAVKAEAPDVLICDARMQPFSADELFELVARYYPAIRGVILTPANEAPIAASPPRRARVTCDEILSAIEPPSG